MTLEGERVRVLWLAKGLGPGGMERLLVNHARAGDHERFRYVVADVVDRPNSVIDELVGTGVEYRRLGSGRAADPRWLSDLRRLVAEERPHIVHSHSPMVAAMARPVLRSMTRRPKLVYTEHSNVGSYRQPVRSAHRLTCRMDDRIIAVSEQARESMPEAVRVDVRVVTHGVDVEGLRGAADRDSARLELGVGPDDFVIGMVANHRTEKDYPTALGAAGRLADGDRSIIVVSLGHGPLFDQTRRMIDERGLAQRFRLLGFRSDARSLMAGFDLLSLNSRVEGLPVAIMEAKALGLPVVATGVGGLIDAVQEGEGLLVPPADEAALAAAWTKLASDPRLLAELAAGSAASAERYSSLRAAAVVEQIYLELVNETSR